MRFPVIISRSLAIHSARGPHPTTSRFLLATSLSINPADRPIVSNFRRDYTMLNFFGASGGKTERGTNGETKVESFPKGKSDDEWRMVLNKQQFRILRNKGTEPPGTGEYNKHYPAEGTYACAGCGTPLYKATTKFNSGCGWPAFYEGLPGALTRHEDRSLGVGRTEITCSACGGHLGHVFKGEGYDTPTDERHCVNSVSLKFQDSE